MFVNPEYLLRYSFKFKSHKPTITFNIILPSGEVKCEQAPVN